MIGELKSGLEHWDDALWWRKFAAPYVARSFHGLLPDERLDILTDEWDNLVILDACRYDMFAEQATLPGELHKRKSAGTNTPEFLKENFQEKDCSDIVYVTANPQVNVHLSDEFFEVVNVWKDRWDDAVKTVPPEAVVEAAIESYDAYPHKRLIVHFVQPHYPFIGECGQGELGQHSGMELSKRMATEGGANRDQQSVWEQLYEGSVSESLVWKAYRENLDVTLPHVERLLEQFEEYTVVTSDHGNAVGERAWPVPVKVYGHPPGLRMPALTMIPWLVTNTANRKSVVAETSDTETTTVDDEVSERLTDLGYT